MKAVDLPALLPLFEDARQRARELNRSVLCVGSFRAPELDPLQLYETWHEGFFWYAHEPQLTLFGFGTQWQIQANGTQRLTDIQRQWEELCADALIFGPKPALLLGGMRFDERTSTAPYWAHFDDASFQLAHWLVSEDTTGRWLRCQQLISPDSDPVNLAQDSLKVYKRLVSHQPSAVGKPAVSERIAMPAGQWQAKVEAALQAINDGKLSKVVLARHIDYRLEQPLNSGVLLRRLYEQRGQTHLFAVHRGDHCFLGATPERLLSGQQGWLNTHALAGSVRRGKTASEDEALGTALLKDDKERLEHNLVVRTIVNGLDTLIETLHVADKPALLKLKHVQHLSTSIKALLGKGHTLLEGIAALHPTPAVGGLPKVEALNFIRDNEEFDRGWYAAPLGWIDSENNGDFLVALRCALITSQSCHLFAGCGIVQGSEPADEYEETQIKLAHMENLIR